MLRSTILQDINSYDLLQSHTSSPTHIKVHSWLIHVLLCQTSYLKVSLYCFPLIKVMKTGTYKVVFE
jgi:hypothetical protein